MRVKTVNEDSSFTLLAIEYFQKIWASKESMEVYRDSITHAKGNKYSTTPQRPGTKTAPKIKQTFIVMAYVKGRIISVIWEFELNNSS